MSASIVLQRAHLNCFATRPPRRRTLTRRSRRNSILPPSTPPCPPLPPCSPSCAASLVPPSLPYLDSSPPAHPPFHLLNAHPTMHRRAVPRLFSPSLPYLSNFSRPSGPEIQFEPHVRRLSNLEHLRSFSWALQGPSTPLPRTSRSR